MKNGVLLFLLFFSCQCFAVFELSGEYGLQKNVFGTNQENEVENTTYTGSLAWYVTSTTAIEFNYVQSTNMNTQNLSNPGSGDYVERIVSEVSTEILGIGIRQLLATQKSPVKPMISIGAAKEFSEFNTTYRFFDSDSSSFLEISENPVEVEEDNAFVTFALAIEFSDHFSIRGSVSSYFPAFEFDQWDKDLRYSAGLSILFF